MDTAYTIQLVFDTSLGKRHSMSIRGADPFVDDDDVKAAMQAIISADVIITANGELTGRNSAKLIKTEAVDINVA